VSNAKRKRRGILRHPVPVAVVIGALAAGAVAAKFLIGTGPPHSISTPTQVGSFVQKPSLASEMGASALRTAIVSGSGGEASHVVDAVYEDSTGVGAQSAPAIILFVGGNLSGSAGSFIDSLTQALPGSFAANPGPLHGRAVCVPGQSGHPAECVWADNDTFGVIASPTLSATALGHELLLLRPLAEHVVR
jgi:hypothetical protein